MSERLSEYESEQLRCTAKRYLRRLEELENSDKSMAFKAGAAEEMVRGLALLLMPFEELQELNPSAYGTERQDA